ncbi:MAG: hypothetical protein IT242_10485 [Bacteroidia bacterium]|nr:hypothetical protein [Bacteroidia bacterium]
MRLRKTQHSRKNFPGCLLLLIFIVTGVAQPAVAQTLVPNPGFEIQDSCPVSSGQLSLAPPWHSPNANSPDLFNALCPTQNISPRTGWGSAGLYAYNLAPNYREYVAAALDSPLVTGRTYCVSFWVKCAAYKYAVGKLGAYLVSGDIHLTTSGPINATPQIENPDSVSLSPPVWTEISGIYTATGGEAHIVIGNFYNDANTSLTIINPNSSSLSAYYQVDDVSVSSCTNGIEEQEMNGTRIKAYPNPAYNEIRLSFSPAIQHGCIILINTCGKTIRTFCRPQVLNGETVLDLHGVDSGLYFLILPCEAGMVFKKINILH